LHVRPLWYAGRDTDKDCRARGVFKPAEAANAQRKVEEMEKGASGANQEVCPLGEDVMGEQKPSWLVIYAGEREYEAQTKRMVLR